MSGQSGTYSFPDLTIVNPHPDRLIKSITVQFTSATASSDAITLPAGGGFSALSGNKNGNRTLSRSSGATAEEWEAYLRANLKVHLAGSSTKGLRVVASFIQVTDTYDYNSENGHYYRAVSSAVTWPQAYAAANSAPSYLGMRGYLVTITSQQENRFVSSLIAMNTWMGGTCSNEYASQYYGKDTYVTGDYCAYYWVAGPETGQLITSGEYDRPRSRWVKVGFNNWVLNEPNDNQESGGETCMHMYGDPDEEPTDLGKWNDFNKNERCAYIIEYGGTPDDETESSDDWAKVDLKIDPSGSTLSSLVNNVEVGEQPVITESVNGDEDVRTRQPDGSTTPADIHRTFYEKDPDAPGGWRELTPDELPNGYPVHAGDYKVVSSADKAVDESGNGTPYTPAESTFSITPKTLDLSELFAAQLQKTYDGTDQLDVAGLDLAPHVLPGADVRLTCDPTATLDSLSTAASKAALTGVSLAGADAGDYRIEGLSGGAVEVAARVLPRELVVTAVPTASWGLAGQALRAPDGSAATYRSDLAVYSGSGEWAPNMLAPRDGRVVGDRVESILGDESFSCRSGSAELDLVSPASGSYALSLTYANVHGAAAALADGGFDAIAPSLVGGGRWDIGNYILTLRDGAVLVVDDPAQDDFSDLPGAITGVVRDPADSAKPPLGAAEAGKVASDVAGDRVEGAPSSVVITQGGKPVDAIDRTQPGTYAITATYPDPAGGPDRVVNVVYEVTLPPVIVADERVDVPYDPDGAPLGPDDVLADAKDLAGDKIPEGSEPRVEITRDGEPADAVDPSVPGTYVVTITYPDPDGGPDKVVRITYVVPEPAGPDGSNGADDSGAGGNGGAGDGSEDGAGSGSAGDGGSSSSGDGSGAAGAGGGGSGGASRLATRLAQTGDAAPLLALVGATALLGAAGGALALHRRRRA